MFDLFMITSIHCRVAQHVDREVHRILFHARCNSCYYVHEIEVIHIRLSIEAESLDAISATLFTLLSEDLT